MIEKDEEEFGLDYKELSGFSIRKEQTVKTLWGAKSGKPLFPRGMLEQGGKLSRAAKLVAEGYSDSQAGNLTGLHYETVSKLRKVLKYQYGIEGECGCGRPGNHMGVCLFRKPREERKCSVQGCIRKHRASGFCELHYKRLRNSIDPAKREKARAAWIERNQDRIKKYTKEYYSRPDIKELHKAYRRKYWSENSKELAKSAKRYRDSLPDGYVKYMICTKIKLARELVPNSLVEAKRSQLVLVRQLKEMR